jgi:hypothetical protein
MSNVFAVATVTEAIVQVLSDSIGAAQVTGAHVTALSPDAESGLPDSGVNVFLYQVTPNTALRNADLPTRAADGTLLRRPQAAVDLDYLITFYGDETRLEQQRLLGVVTRALHARPVLSRTTLQFVQTHVAFLSTSDLAAAPDLVRLRPINFTLEELSKLWSFLLKVDYVLSVAYRAGAVLIDTDDPVPGPALPVLATRVTTLPFLQPVIETIASTSGDVVIVTGGQIRLTGRNFILNQSTDGGLVQADTRVLIGGAPHAPAALTPRSIDLALPLGLTAGPQTVQVTQSLLLGSPPVPHQQGYLSNVLPFMLHPIIPQSSPGVFEITQAPGTITVVVSPTIQPGQRALLELVPAAAATTSNLFDFGVAQTPMDSVTFAISGLAAGQYLVRIRVDGAESQFELDAGGAPVAPVITL